MHVLNATSINKVQIRNMVVLDPITILALSNIACLSLGVLLMIPMKVSLCCVI